MATLYHGTSRENGASIARSGRLNPSQDGCLGAGVYLAKYRKAKGFAETSGPRDRGKGTPGAIIQVSVDLGQCLEAKTAADASGWQARMTRCTAHALECPARRSGASRTLLACTSSAAIISDPFVPPNIRIAIFLVSCPLSFFSEFDTRVPAKEREEMD